MREHRAFCWRALFDNPRAERLQEAAVLGERVGAGDTSSGTRASTARFGTTWNRREPSSNHESPQVATIAAASAG